MALDRILYAATSEFVFHVCVNIIIYYVRDVSYGCVIQINKYLNLLVM